MSDPPAYARFVPEHDAHPDPPPIEPEHGLVLAPGVRVPAGVVRFAYSRSSGPGGQNVNKRSTKAELRVRVIDLPLREGAASRLRVHAAGLITSSDELLISADEHRSQLRNRDACLDRLRAILVAALVVPKVRRKTRPTRGSKERRLEAKRGRSETKSRRRGVD